MYLKIAEVFSDAPGGRYKDEGKYSGEEFRDEFLIPTYNDCIINQEKLIIDFDGGYGYATAFLEETFGGLIRKGYCLDEFNKIVSFMSNDDETLEELVKKYMKEENERINGKSKIRSLFERRKVKK